MVDETRPRSNSLARALLRAHDAVAARLPRTRCFFCAMPLTEGTCPECDAALDRAWVSLGQTDTKAWR